MFPWQKMNWKNVNVRLTSWYTTVSDGSGDFVTPDEYGQGNGDGPDDNTGVGPDSGSDSGQGLEQESEQRSFCASQTAMPASFALDATVSTSMTRDESSFVELSCSSSSCRLACKKLSGWFYGTELWS